MRFIEFPWRTLVSRNRGTNRPFRGTWERLDTVSPTFLLDAISQLTSTSTTRRRAAVCFVTFCGAYRAYSFRIKSEDSHGREEYLSPLNMGEITEKPDLEHDDMEPVRASEFANTTTDGANARSLTSQSRRADTPLTVESQSARLEGTSVIHSRGTSECAENLQHAHAKIIPEDKLPSHAPKTLNGPRADFSPPASASDVSLSDSIGSRQI